MRALVWSLLLIIIVVYATGIFLTKLLGHREDLQEDDQVQEWFGTIWSSMFTLFQMITLEGWNEVARYIMKDQVAGPVFSLLAIGFILFTNLTLLNLVTGIILDHVMNVSREQQRSRSARIELQQAKTTLTLQEVFLEMDSDGGGELTLEDLRYGVEKNEDIRRELLKLEVGMLDLDEIFDMLDLNGSGSITAAEFVDGLMRATGPASAKHLLSLHFDVFKMWQHILDQLEAHRAGGSLLCRGIDSRKSNATDSVCQSAQPAAGRGSMAEASATAPSLHRGELLAAPHRGSMAEPLGRALGTHDVLEQRLASIERRLSQQLDRRFDDLVSRLEANGQLRTFCTL